MKIVKTTGTHRSQSFDINKPLQNNQTELSYLKNINGFDVKVSSNYSLMNEIPDYGANIEVSTNF